jgi:hypothetical protein
MNRHEARKLAETTTTADIIQMFKTAQDKIKDWTVVSRVNKGATIGTTFNILSKAIPADREIHVLGKTNMIWEFGEFLPGYNKPVKKKRGEGINPVHQDPKFI